MPTPLDAPRVALLAPMQLELDPVVDLLSLRPADVAALDGMAPHRGRLEPSGATGPVEVLAVCCGIGTAAAAAATDAVVAAWRPDHVVVHGIAGATTTHAAIGDLVLVESVLHGTTGRRHHPTLLGERAATGTLHTADELVQDPARLAALVADGVVALDMETAAVAERCEAAGVPWSVVRAVSDLPGDQGLTPELLALTGPDGTADEATIAAYLAEDPGRAAALERLGQAASHAAAVAAAATVEACGHLAPALEDPPDRP